VDPATGESRIEGVRNDSVATRNLIVYMRSLAFNTEKMADLPQVDREFIASTKDRVGLIGLTGGVAMGGAAMVLLRNNRPMVRGTGVILSWMIGSGAARVAAVDEALGTMFNLQSPSVLGPAARRIIKTTAEPNGYFARRYNIEIHGTEEEDMPTTDFVDNEQGNYLEDHFVDKFKEQQKEKPVFDTSAVTSGMHHQSNHENDFQEHSFETAWTPEPFPFEDSKEKEKIAIPSYYDDPGALVHTPSQTKSWDEIRKEFRENR